MNPTFYSERRPAARLRQTGGGLEKGTTPNLRLERIDHIACHVADVERCLDALVERMGFALVRSPERRVDPQFREVGMGGFALRIVHMPTVKIQEPAAAQLITLGITTTAPLENAMADAQRLGLQAREIHFEVSGRRFIVLGGVTQDVGEKLTSAVILAEASSDQREYEAQAFRNCPAYDIGVTGVCSVTAEVQDGTGFSRWGKFLGQGFSSAMPVIHHFSAGPRLEIAEGWEDRLSSISIGCHDLLQLARQLDDCGIAAYCCGGGLVVDPADTGGIPMRFVQG